MARKFIEHILINQIEHKVCSCCHYPKPLDGYWKYARAKDGLDYKCKECRADKLATLDAKAKKLESQTKYREKNRQRINCQKKIDKQTKKSDENGLSSSFIINDWEEIIEYFNHKCAYCGSNCIQLQQEHVVPVMKGGHYIKQNIVVACQMCNRDKDIKDMEEWYRGRPFFSEQRLQKIISWTMRDVVIASA